MKLPSVLQEFFQDDTVRQGTILVSTARSGTNYFLDVFSNLVSDSIAYREIFKESGGSYALLEKRLGLTKAAYLDLLGHDPLQLWCDVQAEAAQSHKHVMAKIFYYHAGNCPELWNHFRDNNRVIHLVRRNHFQALVSREVAQLTGKWLQKKNQEAPPLPDPFELPREKALESIRKAQNNVARTRVFFEGSNYHEVFYEDISSNVAACADTIAAIFDVDQASSKITTRLSKQKTYRNEDILTNYSELSDLDRFYN